MGPDGYKKEVLKVKALSNGFIMSACVCAWEGKNVRERGTENMGQKMKNIVTKIINILPPTIVKLTNIPILSRSVSHTNTQLTDVCVYLKRIINKGMVGNWCF